jgi:hypothetical protein
MSSQFAVPGADSYRNARNGVPSTLSLCIVCCGWIILHGRLLLLLHCHTGQGGADSPTLRHHFFVRDELGIGISIHGRSAKARQKGGFKTRSMAIGLLLLLMLIARHESSRQTIAAARQQNGRGQRLARSVELGLQQAAQKVGW